MSFLTDALGSTIALADSSGAIATQYTYEPFGKTTVSGSNANPYQFTGRENDATGLYYFRARYYSPTFQRFIAQDPVGFAGGDANLYAYTLNNPINLRDLLGLCAGGPTPTPMPTPDPQPNPTPTGTPAPPTQPSPPPPCTGPMTPAMCVVCVNALIDVPATGGVAACALTGPAFPECALGVAGVLEGPALVGTLGCLMQ